MNQRHELRGLELLTVVVDWQTGEREARQPSSSGRGDQPTITPTTLKVFRWMVSYGQLMRVLGNASPHVFKVDKPASIPCRLRFHSFLPAPPLPRALLLFLPSISATFRA